MKQSWWNSKGGTVMVAQSYWNSNGGPVMMEQLGWNRNGVTMEGNSHGGTVIVEHGRTVFVEQ